MEPIFVILFLLVAFGSVIILFVGIIQIISNEFYGNKVQWVLICMIGIIGPILYLTKGRKLIIRKKNNFD